MITTKGGTGAGAARDAGARLAKSPLLVFLDADDFLQPRFLESTLRVYLEHTDCWVYTDLITIRDSGKLEDYGVSDWDVRRLWRRGIAGVTCLYTKAQWASVGGFDEISTREDWDFHLRLAMAGYCGIHLPEYLYTYRHATGKRRDEGTKNQEILIIHEKYDLEELKMACKGCGNSKGRANVNTQPDNWESKSTAGFVHLEYIGKNQNDLTFKGPSGRRYLLGNNDYHRFAYVHPGDVRHLLSFKCFRESGQAPPQEAVTAPLKAASKPKAAPPAPIEREPELPAPIPVPVIEPSPITDAQKAPEIAIAATPEIAKVVTEPQVALTDLPKDLKDDTLGADKSTMTVETTIDQDDFDITKTTLVSLREMDLSEHEIDELIQLEKATKNRRTVLAHLRRTQRALAKNTIARTQSGRRRERSHA